MSILIAEDMSFQRDYLRAIIKDNFAQSCPVIEIDDGARAVELARAKAGACGARHKARGAVGRAERCVAEMAQARRGYARLADDKSFTGLLQLHCLNL